MEKLGGFCSVVVDIEGIRLALRDDGSDNGGNGKWTESENGKLHRREEGPEGVEQFHSGMWKIENLLKDNKGHKDGAGWYDDLQTSFPPPH